MKEVTKQTNSLRLKVGYILPRNGRGINEKLQFSFWRVLIWDEENEEGNIYIMLRV